MPRVRTRARATLAALLALPVAAAPAPAEDFDAAGFRVHYEVSGPESGPTVVLLHGYLGSAADWAHAPIATTLAETHRVIAMDVRGHGQSQASDDPDDHGDAAVEDVVRLLDHLGADRADVVGYSMGGLIALRLAVLHPGRVDEVVVGGAGFDPEWDATFDAQVTGVCADLRAGRGFERIFAFMAEPEGVAPTPPEIVEIINASAFAHATRAEWAASLEGFLDWQYDPGQLESCEVPVLLVCGTLDPFITAARGAAERLAHATLVELPGIDHGSAATHPRFTEETLGFIKPD